MHRDLKLENLLLAQQDDISLVKIADFGLAKHAVNGMQTICGTPQYVAPEVIVGQKGHVYGPGVDMWSAGVVLYILLGGYPPFWSESEPQLFDMIRKGKYSFNDPVWAKVSERWVRGWAGLGGTGSGGHARWRWLGSAAREAVQLPSGPHPASVSRVERRKRGGCWAAGVCAAKAIPVLPPCAAKPIHAMRVRGRVEPWARFLASPLTAHPFPSCRCRRESARAAPRTA